MRNWDSCRCWRCRLCPWKFINKFLVNFWTCTFILCIPCIYIYVCMCLRSRLSYVVSCYVNSYVFLHTVSSNTGFSTSSGRRCIIKHSNYSAFSIIPLWLKYKFSGTNINSNSWSQHMCTGSVFLDIKRPVFEADRWLLSTTEVKNLWSCNSPPSRVLTAALSTLQLRRTTWDVRT
jgi:hypothetical protein